MIHIVSSFPRSGSSAMMAALIAGGMDAAWSEQRNGFAKAHADGQYEANPGSQLYEIDQQEYVLPDFPLQYEGKLIKVVEWGLPNLAPNPGGYRVILMRRDPTEIAASFHYAFGSPLTDIDDYESRMARAKAMLANRRDVLCVSEINYADLCDNPRREIERAAACWPIDHVAAAAAIHPSQRRFRAGETMPFRATRKATYNDTISRAKQLKKLAQDAKQQMLDGPISANLLKEILLLCIQIKAENQAAAAVGGMADYVMAQEGDPAYDVAAEWTAMNAAIDAVGARILGDVPTGAGGFRLVETWNGSGVSVRTFTTAQTANLRAALDTLISTID